MKSAIRNPQSAISEARLAYVLCAGIGKRLQPLTLRYPKALLPVGGRPMVFRVFDALRAHGVRRFVVNLHAHPGIVRRVLSDYGRRRRVRMTFLHEKIILNTGGAVRNALRYLTEPFWLVNCDFLPDGFSFAAMELAHARGRCLATLAVRRKRKDDPFNPVGVDRRGRLVRVTNVFGRGGVDRIFLGVHRLEPEALAYLDDQKIFPIFSGLYRNLAAAVRPIQTYTCRPRCLFDLGTLEGYYSANFAGV